VYISAWKSLHCLSVVLATDITLNVVFESLTRKPKPNFSVKCACRTMQATVTSHAIQTSHIPQMQKRGKHAASTWSPQNPRLPSHADQDGEGYELFGNLLPSTLTKETLTNSHSHHLASISSVKSRVEQKVGRSSRSSPEPPSVYRVSSTCLIFNRKFQAAASFMVEISLLKHSNISVWKSPLVSMGGISMLSCWVRMRLG